MSIVFKTRQTKTHATMSRLTTESHIATKADENAFLKMGSEHAKERGLKGAEAEEYANTFRDSMLVMNAFSPA
jgi:hypothetical protein